MLSQLTTLLGLSPKAPTAEAAKAPAMDADFMAVFERAADDSMSGEAPSLSDVPAEEDAPDDATLTAETAETDEVVGERQVSSSQAAETEEMPGTSGFPPVDVEDDGFAAKFREPVDRAATGPVTSEAPEPGNAQGVGHAGRRMGAEVDTQPVAGEEPRLAAVSQTVRQSLAADAQLPVIGARAAMPRPAVASMPTLNAEMATKVESNDPSGEAKAPAAAPVRARSAPVVDMGWETVARGAEPEGNRPPARVVPQGLAETIVAKGAADSVEGEVLARRSATELPIFAQSQPRRQVGSVGVSSPSEKVPTDLGEVQDTRPGPIVPSDVIAAKPRRVEGRQMAPRIVAATTQVPGVGTTETGGVTPAPLAEQNAPVIVPKSLSAGVSAPVPNRPSDERNVAGESMIAGQNPSLGTMGAPARRSRIGPGSAEVPAFKDGPTVQSTPVKRAAQSAPWHPSTAERVMPTDTVIAKVANNPQPKDVAPPRSELPKDAGFTDRIDVRIRLETDQTKAAPISGDRMHSGITVAQGGAGGRNAEVGPAAIAQPPQPVPASRPDQDAPVPVERVIQMGESRSQLPPATLVERDIAELPARGLPAEGRAAPKPQMRAEVVVSAKPDVSNAGDLPRTPSAERIIDTADLSAKPSLGSTALSPPQPMPPNPVSLSAAQVTSPMVVEPKIAVSEVEADLGLLAASDDPDGALPPSATARAASGAPLPRDHAQNVLRQVNEGLAKLSEGSIDIRLSPEELGKVRMQLVTSEQGLIVNVQAERPETLDLLRRHIDQLSRDLAEAGYETAGFNFGDGTDAGQGFGDQASSDDGVGESNSGQRSENGDLAAENDATMTPDSGVDIRV